jgi:DNA-directed RNA polymerase specialized sigma subunit
MNISDILIESHIPMVMDIAKKIGGSKRLEATSVGLLTLVDKVNSLPSDIKNVGAYLRVWVTREIKTFLLADTTIHVPFYGSGSHSHLRHTYNVVGNVAVDGGQTLIDLYEIIYRIPKNRAEETIMQCLMEGGYSLRDMAFLCCLGQARISQIKNDLLDRLQAELRRVER